jgi:pyruvate ferredoxin oxidoreductase alpha subunit
MPRVTLTGNDAAAEALKQCRPDVAAVYPITPQTEMMHKFSEYVADGEVHTELVTVESEHSAMSACVGASAAGARVGTATAACGLALMWEITYVASAMRLPIVMAVINRALSAPINIHCDHSDTMGARDTGWIQLHSENAQEAYDNIIQAFKIAENPDVLLPAMVCLDGFILSHTLETLDILEDKHVWDFVGEYKPKQKLLDFENPKTYGPLDLQDYYFEHRRQQWEAHKHIVPVMEKVATEFGKLSGRQYHLFETHHMDDAEIALIALGSTTGTAMTAAEMLREKGKKVGFIKLRSFRPFPEEQLAEIFQNVHTVIVLDRSMAFGTSGGPLAIEVQSCLYRKPKQPKVVNYIYGLGGRDINVEQIAKVYEDHLDPKFELPEVGFIGLRE